MTGASRGIGRGIALQLGEAGATVYITGRKLVDSQGDPTAGTLKATASEVESRGGKCIPVQCDHSNDEEISALFEKIKTEQNGRLDILVNNAYAAVQAISEYMGKPFWEQPLSMWDTVNNVGLRNHYMCTVYAAKMMVPRKSGLIVNISSAGGLAYLFNVAYGIGKEACDRMAADCAVELRKHNVAHVSIWPGPVITEHVDDMLKASQNAKQKQMFEGAESVEFTGKCIVSLAKDPNLMSKSGRILMTPELGREYNLVDVDGRVIDSMRQINWLLGRNPSTAWVQRWLPNFIKMPFWMFAFVIWRAQSTLCVSWLSFLLALWISKSPRTIRLAPIHHRRESDSLNRTTPTKALTRKLLAVFATVASAVEEQNCKDFVNSVHIIPLQIKIMAKNTTLTIRLIWTHKSAVMVN